MWSHHRDIRDEPHVYVEPCGRRARAQFDLVNYGLLTPEGVEAVAELVDDPAIGRRTAAVGWDTAALLVPKANARELARRLSGIARRHGVKRSDEAAFRRAEERAREGWRRPTEHSAAGGVRDGGSPRLPRAAPG